MMFFLTAKLMEQYAQLDVKNPEVNGLDSKTNVRPPLWKARSHPLISLYRFWTTIPIKVMGPTA